MENVPAGRILIRYQNADAFPVSDYQSGVSHVDVQDRTPVSRLGHSRFPLPIHYNGSDDKVVSNRSFLRPRTTPAGMPVLSSSRRDVLSTLGGVFFLAGDLSAARELRCDVAVIGGGTGGCAAALAAARNGLRVILTEE